MSAGPRVLLLTLSERTSGQGNRYLSGWLGKASVVAFAGEPDKHGNPTWDVFVASRSRGPRRAGARPAGARPGAAAAGPERGQSGRVANFSGAPANTTARPQLAEPARWTRGSGWRGSQYRRPASGARRPPRPTAGPSSRTLWRTWAVEAGPGEPRRSGTGRIRSGRGRATTGRFRSSRGAEEEAEEEAEEAPGAAGGLAAASAGWRRRSVGRNATAAARGLGSVYGPPGREGARERAAVSGTVNRGRPPAGQAPRRRAAAGAAGRRAPRRSCPTAG